MFVRASGYFVTYFSAIVWLLCRRLLRMAAECELSLVASAAHLAINAALLRFDCIARASFQLRDLSFVTREYIVSSNSFRRLI